MMSESPRGYRNAYLGEVASHCVTPSVTPSVIPDVSDIHASMNSKIIFSADLADLPVYIPAELCSSVGMDVATPLDQCMAAVMADLDDDGVAAPTADAEGLREVVVDAAGQDIDMKVVVMAQSPPIDTSLRDVATEIGSVYPGSTVLVLSPGWAGTYSTSFDRVTLEAGQDAAKSSATPVQGAAAFVDKLQTSSDPWVPLTIIAVLAVAVATVLTRVLQRKAARSFPSVSS